MLDHDVEFLKAQGRHFERRRRLGKGAPEEVKAEEEVLRGVAPWRSCLAGRKPAAGRPPW